MAQLHRNAGFDQDALVKALPLFHTVCDIAGSRRLIEDAPGTASTIAGLSPPSQTTTAM
jgi:hypothetical protein